MGELKRCPACSAPTDGSNRTCPSCGASLEELLSSPTMSQPTPAVPTQGSETPPSGSGRPAPGQGRFLPGTLLGGRYRVVGLLGRGGMGEVYRADDTKLGQTVALKFLPETFARDAVHLERFYAEVRIGRQVSHPNVCHLYDLVELDGHHCLSMEYVDGEDLASLLKRIGRLPVDKAIDIARDLCAGLGAAHDKGVIHRDLKPMNVMIDGQGRARITDFGLAALAEEVGGEALAGTPAYMAPEQLDGKPASIRTDLYALGLVLYETFTGKRLFDAKSLVELRALHAETKPPGLSSSVRDIPPAVERMVLACLEKDPGSRPPSVHVAMAALPGGDPLQAALAAGETPSPAMVAAAGKVGDLGASIAWTGLLVALAGLVLVAFLGERTTVIGRVRPDKPPEVLSEKAREIAGKAGYRAPPADSWYGFAFDDAYLEYVPAHDPSPSRWGKIDVVRPGPLLFAYRQSPRKLVALQRDTLGFGPGEVGRIQRDDPPADVPGMIEVVLDRRGWLTGFRAVPPQVDTSSPAGDPDWPALLAAAGLDASGLKPAAPRWAAPVDSDRKSAWDGAYPGQPEIPLHVEAAAYHGKPVWFEVQAPWLRPAAPDFLLGPGPLLRGAAWILLGAFAGGLATVLVLGRRNLRLGRGDRKGAVRLAGVLFVSSTLGLMLRADHVASLLEEWSLVINNILSQTAIWAALIWISYLALEPIARRRWPELLISWSRLLAGRFLDPLVGRDLLLGGLAGIVLAIVAHLGVVAPSWFGLPPPAPRALVLSTLAASRHLLYFFFHGLYLAVVLSLGGLLGLFFYRALLRNRWLALSVQFFIQYVLFAAFLSNGRELRSVSAALFTVIWFAVLLRAGLLASVVSFFCFRMLEATPLTSDLSAWYAGRTLLTVIGLATLLLYGFYAALGGKSPFGHSLFEGEGGG